LAIGPTRLSRVNATSIDDELRDLKVSIRLRALKELDRQADLARRTRRDHASVLLEHAIEAEEAKLAKVA
jgi:hypothetical protein